MELPFPTPVDLPDLVTEPTSFASSSTGRQVLYQLHPLGSPGCCITPINHNKKSQEVAFIHLELKIENAFPIIHLSFSLPCGSAGKESACNVGDLGSVPGLGRSLGEGKG